MIPSIEDIIVKIQKNKSALGISLSAGVTYRTIVPFEEEMGVKLPADIKTFYEFCNGFESDEDMFRIIPLHEIVENSKKKDPYLEKPGDFHIAEYLIYCDMWTLSVDKESNLYSVYNNSGTVTHLTNSFAEFLNRFLEGGVFGVEGLYQWKEELDN